MSDRLDELRRQRALMQEHLAWLEREIAAAEAQSGVARPVTVVPAPTPSPVPAATRSIPTPKLVNVTPAVATSTTPTPLEVAGDEILEKYRVAPKSLQEDVRKGCLLYFFGAFLLLVLVVAALYFGLRHK